MTAAAYSAERRWDIPVYVWPAVLAVSIALHLTVLVFGLPVAEWPQQELDTPPETEVVIESGGVVFEEAAPVETPPLETAAADTAAVVEPATQAISPSAQVAADELQPVAGALTPSAIAPVMISESVVTPALQAATATDAVVVETTEQTEVQPVEIAAAPAAEAGLPEAAPVVVPQSEVATEVQSVAALPAAGDAIEVVAVPEPEPLEVPQFDSDAVTAAPLAQDLSSVDQSAELSPSAGQEPAIVTEVAPVSTLSTVAVEAVQAIAPVANAPTAPPAALTGVTAPEAAPAQTAEVETVSPALQEVEAVAPTETVVAALSPSEPETEAVPTLSAPGEPAVNVPPTEVATIDPLAKVTRYVESYDFGDCAHLSVLDAGADSATVTAFGAGIGPFAMFDRRFAADQGYEASIELRLVTRQQCGLLNALGLSNGIEAAGLVELDSTVVRSGTPVSGVVQRDLPMARIASAQQSGLDLGGQGPPELYLIDDAGQIHDGREFLLPASNARTAGAWRFKVPVTLISGQSEETALVLAIWNRPVERQPAAFGVLAPERISAILAEPGVFSLSAFKVSR